MSVTVVVGAQWGDEGKAKVIDLLARENDVVARYQGGHNAGPCSSSRRESCTSTSRRSSATVWSSTFPRCSPRSTDWKLVACRVPG
jgi:hypothetical protein